MFIPWWSILYQNKKAEERATRGGEEMEPVLDAGEVRMQEQEQREERGGKIPPSLRWKTSSPTRELVSLPEDGPKKVRIWFRILSVYPKGTTFFLLRNIFPITSHPPPCPLTSCEKSMTNAYLKSSLFNSEVTIFFHFKRRKIETSQKSDITTLWKR